MDETARAAERAARRDGSTVALLQARLRSGEPNIVDRLKLRAYCGDKDAERVLPMVTALPAPSMSIRGYFDLLFKLQGRIEGHWESYAPCSNFYHQVNWGIDQSHPCPECRGFVAATLRHGMKWGNRLAVLTCLRAANYALARHADSHDHRNEVCECWTWRSLLDAVRSWMDKPDAEHAEAIRRQCQFIPNHQHSVWYRFGEVATAPEPGQHALELVEVLVMGINDGRVDPIMMPRRLVAEIGATMLEAVTV